MANNQGSWVPPGKQHPITDENGVIHRLDEDTFYATFLWDVRESGRTGEPLHPAASIPFGTDEEKHDILDALFARAQAEGVRLAIWHHPGVTNDSTPTYPIRQSDGSFRQATFEAIVGGLVAGQFNTLETQGTVAEQRAFFGIVRAFIEKVTVNQGHDVTGKRRVNFQERWETGVLATLDSLEEAFENMVLENMKPAAEEEDLVKGMDGMDVD